MWALFFLTQRHLCSSVILRRGYGASSSAHRASSCAARSHSLARAHSSARRTRIFAQTHQMAHPRTHGCAPAAHKSRSHHLLHVTLRTARAWHRLIIFYAARENDCARAHWQINVIKYQSGMEWKSAGGYALRHEQRALSQHAPRGSCSLCNDSRMAPS